MKNNDEEIDLEKTRHYRKYCLHCHKLQWNYIYNYYSNTKVDEWKSIFKVLDDFRNHYHLINMKYDLILCYFFDDCYKCPMGTCNGSKIDSSLYTLLFYYYDVIKLSRKGTNIVKAVSGFFRVLKQIIALGDDDEEI